MRIQNLTNKLTDFSNEIIYFFDKQYYNNQESILYQTHIHNKWFIPENTIFAMQAWAESLSNNNIDEWFTKYKIAKNKKKVLLILAGNIPAVGFHDVLCTLLSGHYALIKLSSEDKVLIPFLLKLLEKHIPEIVNQYTFIDIPITDYDAVIATGSNNSSRYFEKYFSKYPHIIRQNRNSLAILDGLESNSDLKGLQDDIFRYFGLGCRNISLILIPENYDWKHFLNIINEDISILHHNAYANNLTYYTAYFSLMDEKLIDGGTVLLRESSSPSSPPAVLHFHKYKNEKEADIFITEIKHSLQCIVRRKPKKGEIAFGQTQKPAIDDYADGIDTMEFLANL